METDWLIDPTDMAPLTNWRAPRNFSRAFRPANKQFVPSSHRAAAANLTRHEADRIGRALRNPTPYGAFRSLHTPIYRASTVLFERASDISDHWDQRRCGFSYGLHGTPTVLELAGRIAKLEGATGTFITPGGQSALTLIYLAFLHAGAHVLVPDCIYGPSGQFAEEVLTRFGVEVEYYPPMIGGGIIDLIQPNTRLIWCESPGSVTLEVQDVRAIVEAARSFPKITVALDNTWSAGVLLDAFDQGVDVTMQALTKYVGGHGDLLLGSVSVRDERRWNQLGATLSKIGANVSPDDCSLALRGLETMRLRLDRIGSTTAKVARALGHCGSFERILCPCLEGSPGHSTWLREFSGLAGLITLVFEPSVSEEQVHAFVDNLRCFEIGYSWGGTTSLALPVRLGHPRTGELAGRTVVRLSMGLEDPAELLEDLQQALSAIPARTSNRDNLS